MRMIAAIILALVVMVEVFMFVSEETPMKFVAKAKPTGGLFGSSTMVVDVDKQEDTRAKYITVIGSTILVGGIIIWVLPNRKSKSMEG